MLRTPTLEHTVYSELSKEFFLNFLSRFTTYLQLQGILVAFKVPEQMVVFVLVGEKDKQ